MPFLFNNRQIQNSQYHQGQERMSANNSNNSFGMNQQRMSMGFTPSMNPNGFNQQRMPVGMNPNGMNRSGMNPQNMNQQRMISGMNPNTMNSSRMNPNTMNQNTNSSMMNPNNLNQSGINSNAMNVQNGQMMASGQGIPQGPLPDGVRYEPLDENILNLIKKNQDSGTDSSSSKMTEIAPFGIKPLTNYPESNMESLTGKLEKFIQFERNAGIFYKYLSDESPYHEHKKHLDEIVGECAYRKNVYSNMYEHINNKGYSANETPINTLIGYNEGIALAIIEENKIIRELNKFYETADEDKTARQISGLINNKLSCISILHLLHSKI